MIAAGPRARLRRTAKVLACAVAVVAVSRARVAWGFVTTCHQPITADALAQNGWPLAATPPPLDTDHMALLDELAIDVAPAARNLWAMSALIGNLYVDVAAADLRDLAALADLAAQPEAQREHCLRGPADDGDAGDAAALAACKAFILQEVGAALGDGDLPDETAMETVRLHLTFRGDADVPLSKLGFHVGRATHALEDGFSHTFRSADEQMVKTVLNWVDWVRGDGYDEARDGFRHLYALDQCGASDEGGLARRMAATAATSALLAAIANDDGGRAGRLARASAVLDSWLGLVPGCSQANQWCDAPERSQTGLPGGCAVAPTAGGGGGVALFVIGAVWLAGARRRHRRASRRPLAVASLVVVALLAPAVRASDAPATAAQGTTDEQAQPALHRLGVLAKAAVAIDNAGYAFGGGVRYDVSKRITVGVDGEYNPWFSVETGKSVRGATNVFGVGVFRLAVRDYLDLRSTLAAGASILAYDSWAAKKGSVGPYFAVSPLGVAIRVGGHFHLIIDPAEIAVPIPQTTGIPLVYRQHRLSVAVQANF